MMNIRLLAVICALLMQSGGALNAETIVCFGDSLTAGKGVAEDEAYPALVESLARADGLSWKVINAGVSGDTSAGALRRIDWALKAHPDVVFIALGGNDGLRGVSLDSTRSNMQAIIDRVAASNARPMLAGMMLPTNYGDEYRQGFAEIFPQLAAHNHISLMPFLLLDVGGKPELNQADGIHPTPEGQRIVARHVYEFLKTSLAPVAEHSSTVPSTTSAP